MLIILHEMRLLHLQKGINKTEIFMLRLKTNFLYFVSTIIITLKYSMYVGRGVDPKTIMGVIRKNYYWEGMREVNTDKGGKNK